MPLQAPERIILHWICTCRLHLKVAQLGQIRLRAAFRLLTRSSTCSWGKSSSSTVVREDIREVTEWTKVHEEVVIPGFSGFFLCSNINQIDARQGRRLESRRCWWRRKTGRPQGEGGDGAAEDQLHNYSTCTMCQFAFMYLLFCWFVVSMTQEESATYYTFCQPYMFVVKLKNCA